MGVRRARGGRRAPGSRRHGAHPDTVLRNAQELHVDLSDVKEVVLTHHHWDHVRGLMTLRREAVEAAPSALSVVHVARERLQPAGEERRVDDMVAMKKEYEATGGQFVGATVHRDLPGRVALGSRPAKVPERNWSGGGTVKTPDGIVEDTIPEDRPSSSTPSGDSSSSPGAGHAGIVDVPGPRPRRLPGLPPSTPFSGAPPIPRG